MVSRVDAHIPDFAQNLLREAARETGADFDFLVSTAARESNFDADAQARTSSAAGMFQFIEQTWLGMMERHGAQHGFGALAQAISRDAGGRYEVRDDQMRQEILDLRFDPAAAARMAGELAAENAAIIEERTGQSAGAGELYAAHFLGAGGAASLIEAVQSNPDQRADRLFPAAAAANRPIFYDNGRPRTASELLENLTGTARSSSAVPARQGSAEVPARTLAASAAPINPGSFQVGNGELSPMLVEILASLDAPASSRDRKA